MTVTRSGSSANANGQESIWDFTISYAETVMCNQMLSV